MYIFFSIYILKLELNQCESDNQWWSIKEVGSGREVQEGGNICIPMAGSYWCMAETNTLLWSNYPPIKNK